MMHDSDFDAFLASVDAAQAEFARGDPGAFKALWSHSDEVSLFGGHGGVIVVGWDDVSARLDWASSTYRDGHRSTDNISGHVGEDFAYVVRKETIEATIGGGATRSKQQLRVTMVFRRDREGWRIVHRHADSQMSELLPR